MKTDFKPCFASSSEEEDDESWSMGYTEDEAMEEEPFEARQNVISSHSTHKNDDDVAASVKVMDESSVSLPIHLNDMCRDFERNN
ncbi:hypothetical protein SLA2020_381960 [Shorea laevis]